MMREDGENTYQRRNSYPMVEDVGFQIMILARPEGDFRVRRTL